MVAQRGGLPMDASAANAQQAVTVNKPARLLKQSDGTGGAVRNLDVGMMLYPTGNKAGLMWEVDDELGNRGRLNSTLFGLSRCGPVVGAASGRFPPPPKCVPPADHEAGTINPP